MENTLLIDGLSVPINGERNLLELCRKAGIDIPTFCYHSELSVYGACRLCLVDIEGMGIQTSCTIAPRAGMKIKTTTEEIREMRRIAVELMLANHDYNCPTCPKSATCKLQALARRLGVSEVRFKATQPTQPIDRSAPSIERNPNRCVLCGDCVRACSEIQGIGAIDFAYRGANSAVLPAFGKDLNQVECVHCGKCASVCPTGALVPRSEVEDVWKAIDNPNTVVVAQIAPAVRVAIGECFGKPAGTVATGQIAAAMRRIGFNKIFDSSFTADMTVLEEAEEFIGRKTKGENLPIMTSCCPAWVKFTEQYYPDLLPNLSSCKSPQQMFGSVAKKILPGMLKVDPKNLIVVAIMPCTAKKFEARRPEFKTEAGPDVDFVLTTQELARMIEEKGLAFDRLEPESLDMPLGFKTGAGVIFGATGGVSEAVLRYASEKLGGPRGQEIEFREVRGQDGVREAELTFNGVTLKMAIAHGLGNARKLVEKIRSGEAKYDIVEIMACPGGCVGGAGQPISTEQYVAATRAKGLYDADRTMQLHASQDNHKLAECYKEHFGGQVGGHEAHEYLHTEYQSRRRMSQHGFDISSPDDDENKLTVKVCVGTNCYLKGSQDILRRMAHHVQESGLQDRVQVAATFCFEKCGASPNASVNGELIEACSFEKIKAALDAALATAK